MPRNDPQKIKRGSSDGSSHVKENRLTGIDYADMILQVIGMEPGKYNKTEAQIILKWVVSKKNTIALFKSTSIKHLRENKEIFDFKLTEKEIKKIDALIRVCKL